MMKLEDMELFVHVVEQGNFTKAAEYCDIPKSTLSRHINDLEASLGTRLLVRTTRKLTLTETGEQFYEKVRDILQEIELTEKAISHQQTNPTGKLTLYAPVFLNDLFNQQIAEFCDAYPEMSLELLSTTPGQSNVFDKRFDMLLYLGEPEDSSLIARPLAQLKFDYYASPDFLKRYGIPMSPTAVNDYQSINFELGESNAQNWPFGSEMVEINSRFVVDSAYIAKSLAIASLGISRLPKIMVNDEIKSGRLVNLFNGTYVHERRVYGIYHSRHYLPHKIKVLLNTLQSQMQPRINELEQD